MTTGTPRLKEGRLPQTRQTWSNVETLSEEYQRLNSAVRDGGRVINRPQRQPRRIHDRAGGKQGRAVMDQHRSGRPGGWWRPDCRTNSCVRVRHAGNAQSDGWASEGQSLRDGADLLRRYRSLTQADYQGCLRPETPDVCETAISLHYKPLDPERSSARVAFRHSSSRIVAAAVWDDYTLDKGHQRPGMALSGRHEGAAKSAGGTLEGDWRSGQNGEGFLFGTPASS